MSIKELNLENQTFIDYNKTIPDKLITTLFLDSNNVVVSDVDLLFDSEKESVTMTYKKGKRKFDLSEEGDVKSLLPILLLSK